MLVENINDVVLETIRDAEFDEVIEFAQAALNRLNDLKKFQETEKLRVQQEIKRAQEAAMELDEELERMNEATGEVIKEYQIVEEEKEQDIFKALPLAQKKIVVNAQDLANEGKKTFDIKMLMAGKSVNAKAKKIAQENIIQLIELGYIKQAGRGRFALAK